MDNITLIKYFLIMLTSPVWIPFMKELWSEFEAAMEEDGGIFGPKLSPKQKREASQRIAKERMNPQIHITKAHLRIRSASVSSQAPAAQPGPQLGSSRRGFSRR